MDDLTSKNNEAKASNEVAVGSYFPTEEDRQTYYLSVYTGTMESYSPLGRTISCGMGGMRMHSEGFSFSLHIFSWMPQLNILLLKR